MTTEPMSEARFADIEARAANATQGPWRVYLRRAGRRGVVRIVAPTNFSDKQICERVSENDVAFIIHTRRDVPDLVAEVRRIRTLSDGLEDMNTRQERALDAARAELHRWADECLVAMSGLVGTPEKGYLEEGEGGPLRFREDAHELRQIVIALRNEAALKDAEIVRLRGILDENNAIEQQGKADEFIPDDKEQAYALEYADALEDVHACGRTVR